MNNQDQPEDSALLAAFESGARTLGSAPSPAPHAPAPVPEPLAPLPPEAESFPAELPRGNPWIILLWVLSITLILGSFLLLWGINGANDGVFSLGGFDGYSLDSAPTPDYTTQALIGAFAPRLLPLGVLILAGLIFRLALRRDRAGARA